VATVFIVDDDIKFLESVKLMPLENAQIMTFDGPLAAIEAFNLHHPEIIASDVEMPGIHGLAFAVIARELMKPRRFVYISANSRKDVEDRFGSLAPHDFFRKPLDEDFFDFIDALAKDLGSVVERSDSPRSGNAVNSDVIRKVFASWKSINDYEYACLEKAKFTLDREEDYFDKIDAMEKEFKVICEALDVDDESLARIVSQFEREHPSLDSRAEAFLRESVQDVSHSMTHPMDFDFTMSVIRHMRLSQFGLKKSGLDLRLILDGEPATDEQCFYKRRGLFPSRTHSSLKHYGTFRVLQARHDQECAMGARTLFFGAGELPSRSFEERETKRAPCSIGLPEFLVHGHPITEIRVEFDEKGWISHHVAHSGDETLRVRFEHMPTRLPEWFTMTGKHTVSVQRSGPFCYACKLGQDALTPPLDLIVADEVSRGFRYKDNVYFRERALVTFLWEVALGRTEWRLAGQDVHLASLLGKGVKRTG